MKITFLLPHVRLSGGVKALLEYANRIYAMGHEVHIIIPAESHKWYRFGKKLKSLGQQPTILNPKSIDWFDNQVPITTLPSNNAGFIPTADVLIASAWQTAEFAAKLPRETGKKIYFIQHYESLWMRDKKRAEQTYRLPFQKIVISNWLKQILADNFQQEAEVLVTPVDRNLFFCKEKVWNTPPRVCLMHHDYDWKGYKEGIAAIKQVRSQNRKLDLVVFGEKVKDPQELFRETGFEFEYHYRPTRDQVARILSSCDIYLCPSWHEGLGMPPMEAMACRCALVTTDTGGCRDYAIHGETALVSPPKDIEALADNLTAVIDDKQLMTRLSENGEKKIRELDWEENCQRLINLFKSH
ncbi:MAG: glycosyltransferase family 4 protein [Nitrospinae bacterium]|nr:glycosyltransferase family 4 protein [Nitrospinota bacterium]